MLGSSWRPEGGGLSSRIMGRVRPEAPLKTRIDAAQRRLDEQISRLGGYGEKLRKKDDEILQKIAGAQRSNNHGYARAYAGELAHLRKVSRVVCDARLAMEQVRLRLDTVSELGDVVVTLSPCMSVIRGLAPSLAGMMPEASASMQDLSQILGDVMSGSEVPAGMDAAPGGASAETLAILEEAHGVLAGQARSAIPDVPESLKREIVGGQRGALL